MPINHREGIRLKLRVEDETERFVIKKGLEGFQKRKEEKSYETLVDNFNMKKYLNQVEQQKTLNTKKNVGFTLQ